MLRPTQNQSKERGTFVHRPEGVCGKSGKGVLHEDDPHFSELFEALKNASAWRKDFFATLKEGRSIRSGLPCLLAEKHPYQLSPNCRL